MRFITEDTNKGDVKDPLSLNLYTYCQGNPITFVDIDGHGLTDAVSLQRIDGMSIGGGADPTTLLYLLYKMFEEYSLNPSMQYAMQNGDKVVGSINGLKIIAGGNSGNYFDPKDGRNQNQIIRAKIRRSPHANERAGEGRNVGTCINDVQRSKPADVFIQSDGRWVIRGQNGRYHILEFDGEIVTTMNKVTNLADRISSGKWSSLTLEQEKLFMEMFKDYISTKNWH